MIQVCIYRKQNWIGYHNIFHKFFRAIELQMSVIKKPQSLIKALRKYRKEKAYFDTINVFVTSLDKSKITTVTHGDCWSNNFFLSSDNSEVFMYF